MIAGAKHGHTNLIAALEAIDGADRAARFLVDATRPRAGQWWREDFALRFATINGLPGVIIDAPEGPVVACGNFLLTSSVGMDVQSGAVLSLAVRHRQ